MRGGPSSRAGPGGDTSDPPVGANRETLGPQYRATLGSITRAAAVHGGTVPRAIGGAVYSDNETEIDLLGFEDPVEELYSVVTAPAMLPVTVGVLGDWGSGKSSLLKMAAVRLRDAGAITVEFSPWRIETYDDAKTALLSAVLDVVGTLLPPEVDDRSAYQRARETLSALRRRVRWMRVAGLAAKHLVTMTAPTLDEFDGLLKDAPESAAPSTESVSRDFRLEFEALVAQLETDFVVVLVDDLDRCLPEQVLDVLQAIKLFLAVPKTAFVLATDERVVRDAVRIRYPQAVSASETDMPREYLEKIVQVPLRITPLGAAEAESYLNLLVAQTHLSAEQAARCVQRARQARQDNSLAVSMNLGLAREAVGGTLPTEAEQQFALIGQIARPLAAGLKGNPRQLKRYLNAFEMRINTARRRGLKLDHAVLAKLMVLEYVQPRRLAELNEWQAAEGGHPTALRVLEERLDTRRSGVAPGPSASDSGGTAERQPRRIRSEAPLEAASQAWLENPWLAGWLGIKPELSAVDLGPYLELARATLPGLAARARTLSGRHQAVLERMCSASAEVREVAAREAGELSSPDALAIIEAGVDRLAGERTPTPLAISLVEVAVSHPSGLPSVVGGLRSLPLEPLQASLPRTLTDRLRGTPAAADLGEVIRQWSTQTVNARLGRAAVQVLREEG